MDVVIISGNILSRIATPLTSELYEVVDRVCRYKKLGFQYAPSYQSGRWDGFIRLFKSNKGIPRTFPTGLLPDVVAALHQAGVYVKVQKSSSVEEYTPQDLIITLDKLNDIELRDYQKECVETCLERKRGIVQLPTGTGKTIAMAEFIRAVGKGNVLVLIYHSKDLMYQTADVLRNLLNYPVGVLGDNKCNLEEITVAISDRLVREIKKGNQKVISWLNDVYVLCVDEVHHIRADTVQQCSSACSRALYRVGFSGTPFRDQGDDLEIYGSVGGIIYKKTLTWMVENGYLVKPTLYFVQIDAPSWDYNDFIYKGDMDIEDYFETTGSKKFQIFQKHYIWENDKRNKLIAEMAIKLRDAGYRGLVMTTNIEHGRRISELIPDSTFVYGKDPAKIRRGVIEDLASGDKQIVVCTTIYNEGIDCPPATFMIPAQPHRSNVITVQQQGRVLRPYPGKTGAVIIDIIDTNNKWFPRQFKSRLKYYNSEPAVISNSKTVRLML